MRLTADLINTSLSYLNPLKERELDLRGHKIPAIENLGPARDQESIDFTDNDISVLANFPLSPRLQTLLCASNRVASISPNLAKSLPRLSTLVLTGNNLAELADLVPLREFGRLTHLSLVENPVASKENYRYWVLYLAPQIRFLDFQKVKDAERQKGAELFGTTAEPTELARNIMAARSNKSLNYNAAPTANGAGKTTRLKLTDKERKKIEALVRNAKSLAEVQRLEKDLAEGRMPAGVTADDEMYEN